MSDQSPYETLGVTENASYDEIRDARDRLKELHGSDSKHVETIEAAYDAVLMERLRLRQEGRIKVPDRIRFPEKLVAETPSPSPVAVPSPTPNWLEGWVDTPSRNDILLPGGILLGLAAISAFPDYTPLTLALGIIAAIYFLNRKENKLWRALLLTIASSVAGIVVGLQLYALLHHQISLPVEPETVAAWFTFLLLWLVSSFLR